LIGSVEGGYFLAPDSNLAFLRNCFCDLRGKRNAVHGQRMPRWNHVLMGYLQQQRTCAPHFLLQEPWGGVLAIRLQRIRANEFRKVSGLMRRGRMRRTHFE
jgi:hypothetical protein